MQILTDEEIVAVAKQYSGDKSTVEFWFARAIEAAILEKLSSSEPVYQWRKTAGDGRWRDSTKEEAYASVDDFYEARTLFTHPTVDSGDHFAEAIRKLKEE